MIIDLTINALVELVEISASHGRGDVDGSRERPRVFGEDLFQALEEQVAVGLLYGSLFEEDVGVVAGGNANGRGEVRRGAVFS